MYTCVHTHSPHNGRFMILCEAASLLSWGECGQQTTDQIQLLNVSTPSQCFYNLICAF